jgi:hypothetical protein
LGGQLHDPVALHPSLPFIIALYLLKREKSLDPARIKPPFLGPSAHSIATIVTELPRLHIHAYHVTFIL